MLAQPESKVGGKGISPNRINKRQLGFKSLLDNVKKRSQMFLEKTSPALSIAALPLPPLTLEPSFSAAFFSIMGDNPIGSGQTLAYRSWCPRAQLHPGRNI